MPFIDEEILERIAESARRARYVAGEVVCEVTDEAEHEAKRLRLHFAAMAAAFGRRLGELAVQPTPQPPDVQRVRLARLLALARDPRTPIGEAENAARAARRLIAARPDLLTLAEETRQ